MRIVGGTNKGKQLTAPKGADTRPTSDRVREAVFNILNHADGPVPIKDARILDLFAGTGALGLEALSRGAAYALFVDTAPAARGAIRKNAEAIGALGKVKIFNRDATKLGTMPPGAQGPFDLVFIDPPYRKGLDIQALEAARAGNWLAPNARVIVERAANEPDLNAPGFTTDDARTYGDTQMVFLSPEG